MSFSSTPYPGAPSAPHAGAQSSMTQLPVAELERRFQAFAIDRLLSWSLPALAGFLAWRVVGEEPWPIVGATVGTLVVAWLALATILGATGSSPGKSLMGLRVVHHGTGTPIGVGPAMLRSLVLALSGLPTFGIGVATLAWTAVEDRGAQRRGWHDHLADSVVVDVRPVPESQDAAEENAPRHIVNLTAMRLIPAPPVETPAPPARSSEHLMRRQPQPQLPPRPQPHPQSAPPHPHPQPTHVAPPPPRPPAERRPAPAPHGQVTRWLVRLDDGESIDVDGVVLFGRRPEPRTGEVVSRLVALSSTDMSVSKTHAQLGPTGDGAVVAMDRGSTNGTVLVRQGVSRQLAPGRPATLLEGDQVVIGDRHLFVLRRA